MTREEILLFWEQYQYCMQKEKEAKTPRDTAKTLIRPYVLFEHWAVEELEDSIMGNGYVQIGGGVFENEKSHDVPRGRIAVKRVQGKPCKYVTFSLAELYVEIQQELADKPQQLSLF